MDTLNLNSIVDNTINQANSSKLKSLSVASKQKNEKAVAETAKDFEAFFISQMMENMFEGISTEGMFGGGHAEKIYRSMMISEYGKKIAGNGGIGIADHVMRFMIETQNQIDNSQVEKNQGVDHE